MKQTEEKYEVIITHSNGPQVGMIQTAMTEYSRLDENRTVDAIDASFILSFYAYVSTGGKLSFTDYVNEC